MLILGSNTNIKMTAFILYLWIATAGGEYRKEYAWVPSGEFVSAKACESAIIKLGVPQSKARCVSKN